jgi:hypothetical protein
MSRYENAGRSPNIKIGNIFFERVDEFKLFESRLKLGNACYHSVKNPLSSSLLSKNLKMKLSITLIVPVVFYGCET